MPLLLLWNWFGDFRLSTDPNKGRCIFDSLPEKESKVMNAPMFIMTVAAISWEQQILKRKFFSKFLEFFFLFQEKRSKENLQFLCISHLWKIVFLLLQCSKENSVGFLMWNWKPCSSWPLQRFREKNKFWKEIFFSKFLEVITFLPTQHRKSKTCVCTYSNIQRKMGGGDEEDPSLF